VRASGNVPAGTGRIASSARVAVQLIESLPRKSYDRGSYSLGTSGSTSLGACRGPGSEGLPSGMPRRRGPAIRAIPFTLTTLLGCSGPSRDSTAASGADAFGSPDSVTIWTAAQKTAGFPHMERVFPTRRIPAGPTPWVLPQRPADLGRVAFEIDGDTLDVERFMERHRVSGLLVLAEGAVAYEAYRNGHGPARRWTSFSVAKSVVSLLVGAAVQDGYIGSVDDPVSRYLPALSGTSYEGVRVTDLLHMASGVSWNEDYLDLDSDVNRTFRLTLDEQIAYMGALPRAGPPNTIFNYNTGETDLVGAIVRAAVGSNLSDYLERKIWVPAGMEADAYWMLYDTGGGEYGGSGLNASLRDYARIGLLALRGGVLADGTRVVPEGWMEASTTPSPANPGYGWFWWLQGNGAYAALGIFGQMIWIDPQAHVVIVTQSAWETPTGSFPAYFTMARAVTDAIAAAVTGPR